jgi:hypothetical protein
VVAIFAFPGVERVSLGGMREVEERAGFASFSAFQQVVPDRLLARHPSCRAKRVAQSAVLKGAKPVRA